jgi:hypothetical protein
VACVQMRSRSQVWCPLLWSTLSCTYLLLCSHLHTLIGAHCLVVCTRRARCLHLRGRSRALPQAAAHSAQGVTDNPAIAAWPLSPIASLIRQQPPADQHRSAHAAAGDVHAYSLLMTVTLAPTHDWCCCCRCWKLRATLCCLHQTGQACTLLWCHSAPSMTKV